MTIVSSIFQLLHKLKIWSGINSNNELKCRWCIDFWTEGKFRKVIAVSLVLVIDLTLNVLKIFDNKLTWDNLFSLSDERYSILFYLLLIIDKNFNIIL